MTLSTKLSAIALAASTTFATSAFATSNFWDSATPWDVSLVSQYAAWDNFTSSLHNATPEFGTGASLTETSSAASLTSTKNIYNASNTSNFIATLLGTNTTGTFDVYLRAATTGTLLNTNATLNGVAATLVETYLSSGRGVEQEVYWKWNDVSAAGIYVFNFKANETHLSLDQLALAVVTAVPEPSSYAMLALGLGLVGFAARRKRA
ncbi:PEP-CTERM sorting domain-containing protein [Methylobacillus gramineus]|uniref:PEP-CTERM sorting domain-containing protein n=1 Tax=Methylobacillus gramineus TaxID=755169 RepID=UPI001CFF6ED4|nr:PEP-CTERM sorting domain-containing protein [Methylobacillus gramineus]MCB5184166.1 PEP-CTERM sorting domain-containing protein [Methylobacillus gramineus]